MDRVDQSVYQALHNLMGICYLRHMCHERYYGTGFTIGADCGGHHRVLWGESGDQVENAIRQCEYERGIMRQLTTTLEAAQKQASAIPCVKVQVANKTNGVLRQNWERLYTGTEPDYFHGLAVPGDGSLTRVRLTPPADGRKLYRQRVADPGPGSDFSSWVYTGHYDILAVTTAAQGAEASIIWIQSNREIRRIKSMNYGATWGSPELLDYTTTTSIYGLAAAYKPNGDLAIFYAELSTLYVKKCLIGQWQAVAAWNKTAGTLSGVAAIYDNDWCLLVTGKDPAGNYLLWSLVYGDGGDVASGTWSALKTIAFSPSGAEFSFKQPFLDKTDVCRGFFIEAYSGIEAYSRPFATNIVCGSHYDEGLWREPVPFNLVSSFGLAMAHSNNYSWLSSPAGVWRAALDTAPLEVTEDVLKVRGELKPTEGSLTVELNNENGRYAFPGQGSLEVLKKGCQVEFSPGYFTTAGEEYGAARYFTVDSCEQIRSGGKSALIIRAQDGWQTLENWQARYQFRWNKAGNESSVKDILTVILAKAGLRLITISSSAAAAGYYPDFTVNPGNNGKDVVRKLLGFIPDRIFIEGNSAFLLNPQIADTPVYSYGAEHTVIESRFRQGAMAVNRVQTEGWDSGAGKIILVDSCVWDEISCVDDHLRHVIDRNLDTIAAAGQRGTALLRQAEMEMEDSVIVTPVHCGQQLFDVVAVTDFSAGLNAAAKRVMEITFVYSPARGEYLQRTGLGTV
jgi:hypothetical protein